MTAQTDQWFAFRAYNSQTIYGWGTAEEAGRYADHLNARREINVYAPHPVQADEAAAIEARDDGIPLSLALSDIEENAE